MSNSQSQEDPALQSHKRRNVMICASAIVLLSAAVVVTCYFLGANLPGEENNAGSPTSNTNLSSKEKLDISTTSSLIELPSNTPSTLQVVGMLNDESIFKPRSLVPSAHPTLPTSWEVDIITSDRVVQLQLRSQIPSVYPSVSKKVNNIIDDEEHHNNETTVFEGTVTDFLVTDELARISYQDNRCARDEGRWKLQLDTDDYPWEMSWALVKGGQTIASGPPLRRNYAKRTRYIGAMCLETGRYTLQMRDQGGDGICCKWGQGTFSVAIDGNIVVQSDDSDFEAKDFLFDVNHPSESSCFTASIYDSIDNDIANIKINIGNDRARSHFLGGIVRLAAHDFMDFDPHKSLPMGPDGCFDPNHEENDGLETIWCPTCELTLLYKEKYSHISKADFWVASSNAVIRQTSVDNALELKDTFLWGRKDADSCVGSGGRLPKATGCDQTEEVFLKRMGLEWRDVVALMGAHTLGRGEFSGHHGNWVGTDEEAQVFDKKYFDELFNSVWWPIQMGAPTQDWITGRDLSARIMLNTDICLAFDIEDDIDNGIRCCTKTTGQCLERESRKRKCPGYSRTHSRFQAREAVQEMLGGSHPHNKNLPFYIAFAEAWNQATTVGQEDLSPLAESCDSLFV